LKSRDPKFMYVAKGSPVCQFYNLNPDVIKAKAVITDFNIMGDGVGLTEFVEKAVTAVKYLQEQSLGLCDLSDLDKIEVAVSMPQRMIRQGKDLPAKMEHPPFMSTLLKSLNAKEVKLAKQNPKDLHFTNDCEVHWPLLTAAAPLTSA